MRNEDLKTRLIQITPAEVLERVKTWRERRAYWKANSVQPAKKTARKRKSKVQTMLAELSPEQKLALIAELET